jgi:prophage regulatory protein
MMTAQFDRLVRRPEVESRTGLKRSTMYLYIQQGTFPRPVPLGPRAVAWLSSEVDEWIEARIRAARCGPALR